MYKWIDGSMVYLTLLEKYVIKHEYTLSFVELLLHLSGSNNMCSYVYVCMYVCMDGWMDGWMFYLLLCVHTYIGPRGGRMEQFDISIWVL